MAKTTGGRGRAGKRAKAESAKSNSDSKKAEVAEKPRRGRRPGSGKAAAAPPPPAKAGRKAAARGAERAAGGKQPVPASTKGVSLPHTLADVSRAVNVSATTIKYYLNHLPRLIEFDGHGRKRRFSDTAVRMLSDVRRMLTDENKSLSQIRQELEGQGGSVSGAGPARAEKVHHAAPAKVSGSLEDVVGALVGEVRALRSEIEKLRRARWTLSD